MFSYWEQTGFFEERDLIILGGGFVGLWTALSLREKFPHYSITIIERGSIPTGASTKNAGFSCFGSPTELIENAKDYGEKIMWNLVEKRYRGLLKIQKTFSREQIGYQPDGGYECLIGDEADVVADHLHWLNTGLAEITGTVATYVFCREKMSILGLTGFDSLIENKLEGNLNPVSLLQALQQKASKAGIRFLNGLEVIAIEHRQNKVILLTKNGQQLCCGKLVVCVNAFAKELLPEMDVEPKRGQVCITNPIENLKLKGCFHFDRGYYYFRNVENRVLIGGARNLDFEQEDTAVFGNNQKVQNALVDFLSTYILKGKEFTVEQQWSGIMGFGSSKEPIVQQVQDNVFCAVRMSGMGVALAPIVAEEVTALV